MGCCQGLTSNHRSTHDVGAEGSALIGLASYGDDARTALTMV